VELGRPARVFEGGDASVEERGQRIAAELRLGVAEILVAAASSGRAPRRQIDDGGGGAPTGGAGQGGGGTQARKPSGAVLWARAQGTEPCPARTPRGSAGGMPLDSGESRSGTRWAAAPDGPARRARSWACAGLGWAETGAGPSWAVC
jgi:hypothetical protein